jgi:squalene-hopene/tetraprenyl-beta-curcumene cyclase
MNTTDLVHFPALDLPARIAPARPAFAPSRHELSTPVRMSILCAREFLCAEQRLDGSWAGRTTGEVSSLIHLVLLHAFLGRERTELTEQVTRAIHREQRAEGGWARTPSGPFDLDVSALAYFALKLGGEDACGPELARARRVIREHGGADRCGNSTRRWLALLGQIEYELCEPALPEWLLISALCQSEERIDEREIAARSVIWALRPRRDVEMARGIRELFVMRPREWAPAPRNPHFLNWSVNSWWSCCERAGFMPLRRRALERASFLLTEAAAESSIDATDFEGLAYQRIALMALGYQDSCRAIKACERRLVRLIAVDTTADEARSQPKTSLTTDTALALEALGASGLGREQTVIAAGLRWLMEFRVPSETGRCVCEATSLLHAFAAFTDDVEPYDAALPPVMRITPNDTEHANARTADAASPARLRQLVDGLSHGLGIVQRSDGGWAIESAHASARSTGINHAASRRGDTSAAGLTAALSAVVLKNCPLQRLACERADSYLRSTQRGDGSWDSVTHGRYMYGTAWATRALLAAGATCDDRAVAAGLNWLLVHQHESGGWGESQSNCAGQAEFVAAPPTAIQTAWAIVALVAAGWADHDATRRGVQFLVATQHADGNWCDSQLVERDSPHGPWYRNELHSTSWSLLALAKWAVAMREAAEPAPTFRLVCDNAAH